MSAKEEFIEIYRENIRRDGADALLDYLEHKSDFFTAPASARFHGAYAGGLCEHSVNVYHCLTAYLERERVRELYGLEYPAESAALVSLLHDVCKTGCYREGSRNVKGPDGKWQAVPTFFYEDPLPYGHGEKSVYILSGFLRLTREEDQIEAVQQIRARLLSVKDTDQLIDQMLTRDREERHARRPRRVTRAVRDYRLFVNTLKAAFSELRTAGVEADFRVVETDNEYTVTVALPKQSVIEGRQSAQA